MTKEIDGKEVAKHNSRENVSGREHARTSANWQGVWVVIHGR
jgi:hypothetical protein